ncbi:hypothetical protein [Thalassotalea sp. PP2-459]|uniref:hypothetical protein n=1 Tax=Thalassotalea sp. PP2-459 TaxID=1742724 RepID=UPI000941CB86|nr:hypothetical protein [Thalassotalea sp. PP2-459]OKY25128.1 hypothetical protein BI291_03695 [Thalassotalea sp. PP2-459]
MENVDDFMEEYLKTSFRDALLEKMHEPKIKSIIRTIVHKRLGSFPEYTCEWETAEKCTSDILRIVDEQFLKTGSYANRERFKNQKLINHQTKKDYVESYLFTAVHTYCTAKQVKCNQGRKEIRDEHGNIIQTAKKRGKAARAADGNDKLELAVLSESFGLSSISDEVIEKTTEYLKKLHLNEKEIRCFWDRMDGQTFVEMADEYQESNASKEKSMPDLYRKRYQRLLKKIGTKKNKVFDLMTRDSHHSGNQALGNGGFFVSNDETG